MQAPVARPATRRPAGQGSWDSMRRSLTIAAPLLAILLGFAGAADAKNIKRMQASWYDASGHRTASGERFDPRSLTVASRSLPLGTQLRLRSPRTRKTITVRVVDRGPWARGRSLDVTPAVASALGFRWSGHAVLEVAQAPHR